MKTVAILGCGWLGLPLAKKLENSYHLKVSTTTVNKQKELQSLGFEAFLLSEKQQSQLKAFVQCDILIIALPPSKFDDYKGFIKQSISFAKTQKIIFISSTSVYDNCNGIMTEDSKITKPINKILYNTEQLFNLKSSVIFRCAGLMGYDRIAGKYFASREVADKNSLVNYVHQTDVIKAIEFVINKQLNGIFNLCSKEHLSKEEIYTYNAKRYGFAMPIFQEKEQKSRVIDGSLITTLGFSYTYETLKAYE